VGLQLGLQRRSIPHSVPDEYDACAPTRDQHDYVDDAEQHARQRGPLPDYNRGGEVTPSSHSKLGAISLLAFPDVIDSRTVMTRKYWEGEK
jgi:hypothetical protein